MINLKEIFRFGWPYLRQYRGRLIAGILLGLLFGISNASFVWATRTLFDRLTPAEQRAEAHAKEAAKPKAPSNGFKQRLEHLQHSAEAALDPILPLRDRPLSALQVMGGMCLLPLLVFVRGAMGYASSYC